MDATKAHAILCNIAVICVGTMALGLVISWWLRRDLTTAGIPMQGKVKTDPYHIMDLGAAAFLIILHLSPLIAVATLTPEAAEAAEATGKESNGVSIHSAISLAFFSLVLGICVFVSPQCFAAGNLVQCSVCPASPPALSCAGQSRQCLLPIP